MAENSKSDSDRAAWLRIAQQWLRMLRGLRGNETPKKINQAGLRGETMTQRVGISPHGRAWRASQKAMTALPPKADICSALGCVCFGP